ncbi:MAG: VOC family protein [Deltaproteobacteria bacterium]|nr:VOC family protein [Deltaproteobacteria bacterium]
MYKGIDHIALAAKDIAQATEFFQSAFKLDLIMPLSYPADGVHTNLVFSLGPDNELELMGPLGDHGFLVQFLERNGEGLHHLALEVTDIDRHTEELEQNGVRVFGRTDALGMRFTFLHPKSTLLVGMQLMQRKPQKPSRDPMIKGIDYVAIRVEQPQEGRHFFLRQLGADMVSSEREPVLDCWSDHFVLGKAHFLLLYDFRSGSAVAAPEGLHHVALKVDSLSDAVRHLEQYNVLPLENWSGDHSALLSPDHTFGCVFRLIQRS